LAQNANTPIAVRRRPHGGPTKLKVPLSSATGEFLLSHPANSTPVVVVVDSRPVDYVTFAPWARANVVEFRFLSSGLNALRMARAVKPALWIINVELPEMTGFDLLEMLRVTIEDQLVVMVADQYQSQNELRSAELNASFFACKPLDVSWFDKLLRGGTRRSHFCGEQSPHSTTGKRQQLPLEKKPP
jgi:DNA-binding response OmpR family regulator